MSRIPVRFTPIVRLLACALISASAFAEAHAASVPPTKIADPMHSWIGLTKPAQLDQWVDFHVARFNEAVKKLIAKRQSHTVAVDLALYDEARAELDLATTQVSDLISRVAPDKAIRDEAEKQNQRLQEIGNEFTLNHEVYEVLAAIDASKADAATQYYLQRSLLEYRLAGADRTPEERAKVKALLDQISQKGIDFEHNIAVDVRKVTVSDAKELDGLPADYVALHKPDANGVITLTTDAPDFGPVMSYAKSADLRRRMLIAYNSRAYPDNRQVLIDMLRARNQVAHLLGFPTWPDFAMADQMMGSRAKLNAFFEKTDAASREQARAEYQKVLAFAQAHDASIKDLDQSSAGYWNDNYSKETFGFDAQSMRPYFPYEQVERGILEITGKLFHVEFVRNTTMPLWDKSVSAWDVIDRDTSSPRVGKRIGRIYLDMHPREGKDKWFNSSTVVPGILGKQLPEGRLVCNFAGGKEGDPGLMEFGEVQTFFHELGHLMHSTLGGFQKYDGISGISTEGDFVEAPSQMLEELIHDPSILQSFGKHYQSGEVIPTALIETMNHASQFGRANWTSRQLFYSAYASDVHAADSDTLDPDKLWDSEWQKYVVISQVPDMHQFANFGHLVGYSSNYYTYVLDKVIAIDFFAQFDRKHLLDGPTALRYRHAVLEPGGSKPAQKLVEDFLGRDESFEPFSRWVKGEN